MKAWILKMFSVFYPTLLVFFQLCNPFFFLFHFLLKHIEVVPEIDFTPRHTLLHYVILTKHTNTETFSKKLIT